MHRGSWWFHHRKRAHLCGAQGQEGRLLGAMSGAGRSGSGLKFRAVDFTTKSTNIYKVAVVITRYFTTKSTNISVKTFRCCYKVVVKLLLQISKLVLSFGIQHGCPVFLHAPSCKEIAGPVKGETSMGVAVSLLLQGNSQL